MYYFALVIFFVLSIQNIFASEQAIEIYGSKPKNVQVMLSAEYVATNDTFLCMQNLLGGNRGPKTEIKTFGNRAEDVNQFKLLGEVSLNKYGYCGYRLRGINLDLSGAGAQFGAVIRVGFVKEIDPKSSKYFKNIDHLDCSVVSTTGYPILQCNSVQNESGLNFFLTGKDLMSPVIQKISINLK